jgi:TM2 domain-containing membrane protein YozV
MTLHRPALSIIFSLALASGVVAGGPYPVSDPLAGVELPDTTITRENNRLVAGLLATFLGPFGAHRLYLGTNARVAVVYGLTFGGFGVLPLLDLGHLIFAKSIDPYRDNVQVFMWRQRSATPP